MREIADLINDLGLIAIWVWVCLRNDLNKDDVKL